MIKNNLRSIRTKKGLSQAQLSYKAKVSPSIISNIENEKMIAYPGWKRRIAKALEVSEADIWEADE